MNSGYHNSYFLIFISLITLSCNTAKRQPKKPPNILIAIADDATYKHFGAYGTDWVKTPNFDKVAEQGILFMNAYTPNAKCAPSRSCIITGRNSWQLEAAANHWGYFPKKFKTYPEVLKEHGYFTGYTGKGWAPGKPGTINGHPRRLLGQPYEKIKTKPPTSGISSTDYAANFKAFLDDKPNDEPFCFWYGGHEPHRGYEWKSGINKDGKKLSQIGNKDIPDFFPKNDTVRTDLLDYAYEIEYFDKHLGRMLKDLKERGELHNTLVLVMSDNGMPFPRIKGQEYEYSNHLPLAIMWPDGIKNPGRKVTDFVSYIDYAPTFLQLAGVDPKKSGMKPITGKSLTDIFYSNKSGRVDSSRDHVVIGKERHDVGRPHDWGYPIRGIITDNYIYLHNFKTNRWPAGDPVTGYLNCDGSPTKTWILNHRTDPELHNYWQLSFGKRVADELYDIGKDPGCMINLAAQQENKAYQNIEARLHQKLFDQLKDQKDPRMFGNGEVFDKYPYADTKHQHFYQKYMNGEIDKTDAGWVNPSDFEDHKLD